MTGMEIVFVVVKIAVWVWIIEKNPVIWGKKKEEK